MPGKASTLVKASLFHAEICLWLLALGLMHRGHGHHACSVVRTDLWGHDWSGAELADASFVVRGPTVGEDAITFLDWIPVRVHGGRDGSTRHDSERPGREESICSRTSPSAVSGHG